MLRLPTFNLKFITTIPTTKYIYIKFLVVVVTLKVLFEFFFQRLMGAVFLYILCVFSNPEPVAHTHIRIVAAVKMQKTL